MSIHDASQFAVGQRWLSETETEQGLGLLTQIEGRMLTLLFPATEEIRHYAMDAAPLARYQLFVDDIGSHQAGWNFRVEKIETKQGVHHYFGTRQDSGEAVTVIETQLAANVATSHPLTRILAGKVHRLDLYRLRQQALKYFGQWQQSGVVGLLGARAELLPHQLYVADQVANRALPRVMLADEVGLGKTIEAGYIIQRRLLTGRSKRLLIIVPDALCHQWLVELQRRFGLTVSLFDEQRCEQSLSGEQAVFSTEQRVLIPQSLLQHPLWSDELTEVNWDLVIIDEAHQLNPNSAAGLKIRQLCPAETGLILLTATPEQAGLRAHFDWLTVLDPQRFHDYQAFCREQEDYHQLADIAATLAADHSLSTSQIDVLTEKLGQQEFATETSEQRHHLLTELLDRHATGRVMFRNSRSHVGGFPKRILHDYPLTSDSKAEWLLQLLKQQRGEKFVLICASSSLALELAEFLRVKAGIYAALFHEQQTLIERDRAAAYFANPEEACPILICSELGSEGRNFQFVQHLILFDLPAHPDTLEQRIGRLDRIGQASEVHLHVPLLGWQDQVRFTWYQAMAAFAQPNAIGSGLFAQFRDQVAALEQLSSAEHGPLQTLATATQTAAQELREQVAQGRDRLQELNACRPAAAEQLVNSIEAVTEQLPLRKFLLQFWEHFGLEYDSLDQLTGWLRPTEHLRVPLSGINDEGLTVTFDRNYALNHEDVVYLTWDHPHVQEALELFAREPFGSTCVGLLNNRALAAGTWFLEVNFKTEILAPVHLAGQEFYPPQLLRVFVDSTGRNLSERVAAEALEAQLRHVDKKQARLILKQLRSPIQQLLGSTWEPAEQLQQPLIERAQQRLQTQLGQQIERLRYLSTRNPAVTAEDIEQVRQRQHTLMQALTAPVLQLDSIRVIVNVPQ